MRFKHFLLVITALLLLVACGKKGPVRPLEEDLPNAVQKVELRQRGDELLLSWQLPTHNQDGTPLEQAPAVDVYRMLFDPADDCPECKDRSTLRYSIDPELPHPARLSGGRYLLIDRDVAAGLGYHYRLVPRDSSGLDGQPLVVRIAFIEPPAAPAKFSVEPHDRSATLSWQPAQPAAGQQLLGYRIYRFQKGDGKPMVLLNQRPITETEYTDFSLINGTEYGYQVRSALKKGNRIIESLPSASVSAIPQTGL